MHFNFTFDKTGQGAVPGVMVFGSQATIFWFNYFAMRLFWVSEAVDRFLITLDYIFAQNKRFGDFQVYF